MTRSRPPGGQEIALPAANVSGVSGVRRGWVVSAVPAAVLAAALALPGEQPAPPLPAEVPQQTQPRPDTAAGTTLRSRPRAPGAVVAADPAPAPAAADSPAPTAPEPAPEPEPTATRTPEPTREPTLRDCVEHLLTAPFDC